MTEARHSAPGLKGIRLADEPTLSIVVASNGDLETLRRCLAALLPPCQEHAVEVVVARACSGAEYRQLEREYPKVLFMPATNGAELRQLRMVGFSAADGDIVTIIEDDRIVDRDWVRRLAPRRLA